MNSFRQITPVTTTRRGSFTVPPYNGRTFSSPRPTPSSLKKLLSLWTRDQNSSINEIVPSSPGEVSPGEVRLTGLSVDKSQLPSVPTSSATGKKSAVPTEVADKNKLKADNASRNLNPHFSETHTPERKAEENKKKVLPADGSHRKKHKRKRDARSKSHRPNPVIKPVDLSSEKPDFESSEDEQELFGNLEDEIDFLFGSDKRPDTPIPDDRLWRESDSESDMDEFVNKLIGDREAWQGAEKDHGEYQFIEKPKSCLMFGSVTVHRQFNSRPWTLKLVSVRMV